MVFPSTLVGTYIIGWLRYLGSLKTPWIHRRSTSLRPGFTLSEVCFEEWAGEGSEADHLFPCWEKR